MLLFHTHVTFSLTIMFIFFFFKQKTAYEMRISDWSSDVCSSVVARSWLAEIPGAGAFARCAARSRTAGDHGRQRAPERWLSLRLSAAFRVRPGVYRGYLLQRHAAPQREGPARSDCRICRQAGDRKRTRLNSSH